MTDHAMPRKEWRLFVVLNENHPRDIILHGSYEDEPSFTMARKELDRMLNIEHTYSIPSWYPDIEQAFFEKEEKTEIYNKEWVK